jgi:putative hydrolase of the HAD superfamily
MISKRYKHLLFDLDGTLWDFRKASFDSLASLFKDAGLKDKGIADFESFHRIFKQINEDLWAYYRRGEMSREVLSNKRFQLALAHFGIDDPSLSHWFGEEYLARSTQEDHTFPEAKEVLSILRKRTYRMHILTNGFFQVQQEKMLRSGLRPFFELILSSEEVGIGKPEPAFFDAAMKRIKANSEECLMIGDDLDSDIEGARRAGIDQVWFRCTTTGDNPLEDVATHRICSLSELIDLLP